ncbi:MAG: DNA-binding protein [Thaumarchaeota archaeon]|nr:DNA-binding protein [Nitrososphaerota archaeon]
MSEGPTQSSDSVQAQREKQLARENILRVLLTSDARQRLTNIRMVRPETAAVIEDNIIRLAAEGKIKKAITDDEIKAFLASLQQPKREFKIKWA